MLKKRDLQECHSLYELVVDPAVFPYVRYKPKSYEEYLFMTKHVIADEEQGTCISRTILNEVGYPIGTIDVYDIVDGEGFMATWIGKPYFGQGYNQRVKECFFAELFLKYNIQTVFLKIRKQNIRSLRAIEKLPYAKFEIIYVTTYIGQSTGLNQFLIFIRWNAQALWNTLKQFITLLLLKDR